MTDRLKLKIADFTAEDLDRFPDGDYTVGRGADPRGGPTGAERKSSAKKLKLKLRPIPAGWADQFPDGDYTVGPGADPRGAAERAADKAAKTPAAKPAKTRRARKPLRPAAE